MVMRKSKSSAASRAKRKAELLYNGIQFRSKEEIYCYQEFVSAGFKVAYEGYKFVICDSFISDTFYKSIDSKDKAKKGVIFPQEKKKAQPIVYTVDFFVNDKWVIEYKPCYAMIKEDDNIKMKMARAIITNESRPVIFMLITGKKEIQQAIDIIKREGL